MDNITRQARSEVMRRVRSRHTAPEMIVRRLTHAMGYRYRLHGDLPGKPDLVFAGRRKVIFVHGCFWHMHRNCGRSRMPSSMVDYWQAKLTRNVERDRESRRKLTRLGWRSLVLWECETRHPETIAERIKAFLDA